MELSRNGATADHGTYFFKTKRLNVRLLARHEGAELGVKLLFTGSLHAGSTHNYSLHLTGEEIARLLSSLANPSGANMKAVADALAGSSRDLMRLQMLAAGGVVETE